MAKARACKALIPGSSPGAASRPHLIYSPNVNFEPVQAPLPRARPDALILLAVCALVSLIGLRIVLGHDRFLDNDELEHLNGAYFISQGETIYGSFFENHPPLLAWALQPIVRSVESPEAMISAARAAILFVQLGILVLTAVIARRLAGGLAACLAPILLLSQSFFYQKTLEIRPDVPGTLFFMLALERMGAPAAGPSARRLILVGIYLCIGGLFTPKLIYAAAGAAISLAIASNWSSPARWRGVFQTLLWIALGGVLVAGLVFAELAREGVLVGFIDDAVVQSLRMTIDHVDWFRRVFISATAKTDAATWILSIAGVGIAFFSSHRDLLTDTQRREVVILIGSAALGISGLFMIKSPLPQYYLCFLPQCLILASWAVSSAVTEIRTRSGVMVAIGALVLALAICAVPPLRYQLVRTNSYQPQIDIINTVRAVTRPDQRVFSCWSGLYLTRLPAYRYFFLNSDVQRLLDPVEMERELLAVLSRTEVATYLHDRNCNELPRSVKLKLRQTFVPHPDSPEVVFVRR